MINKWNTWQSRRISTYIVNFSRITQLSYTCLTISLTGYSTLIVNEFLLRLLLLFLILFSDKKNRVILSNIEKRNLFNIYSTYMLFFVRSYYCKIKRMSRIFFIIANKKLLGASIVIRMKPLNLVLPQTRIQQQHWYKF